MRSTPCGTARATIPARGSGSRSIAAPTSVSGMETCRSGLAPVQFGWDLADPAYYNAGVFPTSYPGYWGNVALTSKISAPGAVTTYAAVAQAGSNTVADLTDTFGDLDAFKAAGGKMVTFVGANDALIMPRGVINYYRVMAERYADWYHTVAIRRFVRPLPGHSEILPSVPCSRRESLRPRHSEPQQPRAVAAERRRLQCSRQLGRERHCAEPSDGVGQHGGARLHPRVAHHPYTSAMPLSANRGV